MRLNAGRVTPAVSVADATNVRPIRIRLCGTLVLATDVDEAIELARELVAAVDRVRAAKDVVTDDR